nr:MAG TPA: hypothetical protein [Caudoviricetes sp.]
MPTGKSWRMPGWGMKLSCKTLCILWKRKLND